MRKDDILGLNFDLYPRQSFGAGDIVLGEGTETDRLFVVLSGRLGVGSASKPLGPGDVVKPHWDTRAHREPDPIDRSGGPGGDQNAPKPVPRLSKTRLSKCRSTICVGCMGKAAQERSGRLLCASA